MKTSDMIKFLCRRIKRDKPKAFIFRLIRLGIIAFFKLWQEIMWRTVFKFDGDSTVAVIQGSMMRFFKADIGIGRDLLLNGIREPYATEAFTKLLEPGQTIVDIGSNIGYYALQESRIVGESGMVYALEPSDTSVVQLAHNFSLNDYENYAIYEIAVGNRDGWADLYVTDASNLCTLNKDATHKYREVKKVPIVKLDTFFRDKPYPDVIRMDVEGYELEIIKGMAALLAIQNPLILFIELHMDILGEQVKELALLLKMASFEIVSASLEPHPAVMNYRIGKWLTAFCDKQIGFPQGYGQITVDDLIQKDIYSSGQIEWLEVIFRR